MRPHTILFDYGGTLDTCGIHWFQMFVQAWEKWAANASAERQWEIYVATERLLAQPTAVLPTDTFRDVLVKKLRQHLALLGCPEVEHETQRIATRLDNAVRNNLQVVRPLIQELHQDVSLCLASNFYGNLQTVLSDYDLQLFDVVVESACIGIRKPDVAFWQYALNQANCRPEEAVAVGDSLKNDMLPACAIGCQTIWLNPSLDINEHPSATHIVHNYTELRQTLLQMIRQEDGNRS